MIASAISVFSICVLASFFIEDVEELRANGADKRLLIVIGGPTGQIASTVTSEFSL